MPVGRVDPGGRGGLTQLGQPRQAVYRMPVILSQDEKKLLYVYAGLKDNHPSANYPLGQITHYNNN